jgi:hypothetical protein
MKFRSLFDRLLRRDPASYHQLDARGNVLTLISVVTMTAPKTFSGAAVLVTVTPSSSQGNSVVAGGAVAQTRSDSSPTSDSQQSPDSAPTDVSSDSTAAAPAAASSTAESAPTDVASATNAVSSPAVTSAPSSTTAVGTGAIGLGAASSSATHAASTTAPESKGMTGGAKAGLAFGIIALIGLALAGVILLYRRKKQEAEAHERLDDEKAAMARPDALPSHPSPQPVSMAAAPVMRSHQPSMSTVNAPQLSLRPVTQFDPRMSSVDPAVPAGAAGLAAGAVAGAAVAKSGSASPKNGSTWEKRGAERHANDPTNPFGNHAETVNGSPPHGSPANAALAAGAVGAAAGATLAAGAQRRPASPGHIDAADFPLPNSGPPSPKPVSLRSEGSSDGYSNAGVSSNGAASNGAASTASIPSSLKPGEAAAAAAGAGAAAGVAGAAVAAGVGGKATPAGDNVHRVQLDFKPSMEDELEIRAGQLVRMLHEYDDGWVSFSDSLEHDNAQVQYRHFASAWTVLNRVSFPVHAYLSIR